MNALKIWIYEDVLKAAERWADSINAAYDEAEVCIAGKDEVKGLFETLYRRRSPSRVQGGNPEEWPVHDVDAADVVVLDYDLLEYWKGQTGDTTGSRLAYLLRCFTECGYIIVLNQYGHNVFDLSLGSPADNFADLHVSGEQIGNPGLWKTPFDGYRPWHWPVIPLACENFRKCVNDVAENLEEDDPKPLIEFLGLNRAIDWMPMQARRFLAGGKKPLEEITFNDFVNSSHGGVEVKDRDNLRPRQVARVAASRISTLLNDIIFPAQNALVDAPHLASRFGSVFLINQGGIEDWNKLCDPTDPGIEHLLDETLNDHRFANPHWLRRPAWYWPEVNSNENIKEVRDPWSSTESQSGWVFCEDVSRFVQDEHVLSFRASVSPPFIKRYVCDKHSEEARRSVNDAVDDEPTDLSQVEYVPQSAFIQ
ncbi:MAG: hypothetical protein OXM01_08940 [Gemmatimonadota bacterium]|nr:hypothetical protein [Gemmatimonadota bacterium]